MHVKGDVADALKLLAGNIFVSAAISVTDVIFVFLIRSGSKYIAASEWKWMGQLCADHNTGIALFVLNFGLILGVLVWK